MKSFVGFIFLSIVLFSVKGATRAQRLNLTFTEDFPSPRSIFKEQNSKSMAVPSLMLQTKKAIERGHFKTCLIKLSALKSKAPEILNWLETEELLCRHNQFNKEKSKQASALWLLVNQLYKNSKLKSNTPSQALMLERWRGASLDLFNWQVKSQPRKAWANFEQLQIYSKDLDNDENAMLFSNAGDLSLKRGDEKAAADFWARSLGFKKNNVLKNRLARLRKKIKLPALEEEPEEEPREVVATSEEEEELYKRFKSAVRSKDHLVAVRDGVEIINRFPGGKKADRASKQIISVYLALARSKKNELQLVKTRVLELMKKADPVRILNWARVMNKREYFQDALVIAEDRVDDVKGQPLAAQVLLLVGDSYLNVGEFESAESAFARIVKRHSGSKVWPTAIFKLGVISYRLKKYSQAEKYFEKYLNVENNEDYNLSSHYWLWRSLQKQNSNQADKARDNLMKRYPVSYYGLRAMLEMHSGQLKYDAGTKAKDWKVDIALTAAEKKSWQRAKLLVAGSWFSEAQKELSSLPVPKSPKAKIVWARVWASVLNYPKALELVGSVWEKDHRLVNRKVIELIYPKEFIWLIEPQAKRYGLDSKLVLALMRQESSFLYNVASFAGALGLMQIMPATGREVARDIRVRNFSARRDLLDPRINIKIGTNYLYRLTRAFKGHIPLSLAAYNAGIGNIRAWMKNRTDLVSSEMSLQDPDSELWMEELPWLETSGYVKNILRNWVIYRYLDESAIKIGVPVWKLSP